MEEKNETIPPITTGSWLVTIILSTIPVVNLVALLYWAFSKSTDPNKANWSRAMLILILISIILFIAVAAISGISIFGLLSEGPDFIENPVY